MRVRSTRIDRSRATVAAASLQAGRAPATAFSQALLDRQLAAHQAMLKDLCAALEAQADHLSATTSLLEWETFRTSVLAYLQEVQSGYSLRKQAAWDPEGNQRLLVLVDATNQELIELGMAFIEKQNDNWAFLARVKRLKGLLIDLKS